jgi:hypothetical protein
MFNKFASWTSACISVSISIGIGTTLGCGANENEEEKLVRALVARNAASDNAMEEIDPVEPLGRPVVDRLKQEQATEAQLVQTDVKRMVESLYDLDIDTLLDFTHPRIIDMLGGKVAARKSLLTNLDAIRSKGMKLQSLQFPSTPVFLKGQTNEFTIVPTISVISFADSSRVESLNYQLGARPIGGKRWTYVEGSRMNERTAPLLFADFPSGFEFPATYRKRVP